MTMLSCVLNSNRAIKVNIKIIRIFTQLREMVMTNKDILLQLEVLEKRHFEHDKQIEQIFYHLKKLLQKPAAPRKPIGFKTNK